MADRLIGHEWCDRPGIRPALKLAIEISGSHVYLCTRIVTTEWVLDYEFRTYGRYRVGSTREHWLDRMPGTAHLYPPGTTFWEDTRNEAGDRHSAWIHVAGGSDAGLDRFVDPRYGYCRFLDVSGRLGAVIHRTALTGHQLGEAGFWAGQARLFEAVDLLHRSVHVEGETFRIGAEGEEAASPGFVLQVMEFLKSNVGRAITLGDIARSLRASPSTVSHRYRSESGESPMTSFARLRIAHAKALLEKGYPAKIVADRLGYVDQFHFSRAFKRVVGISPRQFVRVASQGQTFSGPDLIDPEEGSRPGRAGPPRV